jgi:hypothetical protein
MRALRPARSLLTGATAKPLAAPRLRGTAHARAATARRFPRHAL